MPYLAPMVLEDGFTVITISAKDKFGNTAELTLSLEIDLHPPTFEPESGTIYSRSKSHRESVEVAEETSLQLTTMKVMILISK
ncbi:MAG: hypothetical protein R2883_00535 [Caldisericia bacterium]